MCRAGRGQALQWQFGSGALQLWKHLFQVDRLSLGTVEENTMDGRVAGKESIEVIGDNGPVVNVGIQARAAETGLQHIPQCNARLRKVGRFCLS